MKNKYLPILLGIILISISCENIKKNQLIEEAEKHKKLGNYNHAIEIYDKLIRLDSSDEGSYIMKGHIFNELQELNKAEEAFQTALNINPKNLWGYAGLSNTKREKRDYISALELINKSIELSPKNETTINSQYQILQEISRFIETTKDIEKSCQYSERAQLVCSNKMSIEFIKEIKKKVCH